MHIPPPPNSRDLLPPLLACLPASFVSPRPPPALLPLLSPLLRQRVTYLAGNTGDDGWLRLLSWNTQRASKIAAVVEKVDLEPHPVSGELEIEEPKPAAYRRLDEETLQARLEVEQFDLLPIFVWCEKDDHGGTEPGWKLSELRTLDDREDGTEWFENVSEAITATTAPTSVGAAQPEPAVEEDDDRNNDYWASYDRTPARTPAKRSPAPVTLSTLQMTSRQQDRDETDYYARYGEEVQPAMDSHDPDEETAESGDSTLNGTTVLRPREPESTSSNAIAEQAEYLRSLQSHTEWKQPHDSAIHTAKEQSISGDRGLSLSMPRPISPAPSHSSIDKLEERAAAMSSTSDDDRAQLAVKQHISTDLKSLFRLAKASGLDRREFTRIVQTELDVLGFMEQDE